MRYSLVIGLVLCYAAAHADTTLTPLAGGADNTARIQEACNIGPVHLAYSVTNGGQFPVKGVTCLYIDGTAEGGSEFYNIPRIQMVGTDPSQAVITCPGTNVCTYANFAINPAPNGGIGVSNGGNSIHGLHLYNMTVVAASTGSGSCIDLHGGGTKQDLQVRNGFYGHCGGYCFDESYPDSGSLSDGSVIGATIFNCEKGLINFFATDNFRFVGNFFEGSFGNPAIFIDLSNQGQVFVGNDFDENYINIIFGNVNNAVISGNVSTRLQGGPFFQAWGAVQNLHWVSNVNDGSGADFQVVNPGNNGSPGSISGDILDLNPTFYDAYTTSVMQGCCR
jgi:hypothetical protein